MQLPLLDMNIKLTITDFTKWNSMILNPWK